MEFTEPRQRLLRLEPAALARMRNGDSLPDLLNFDEHWEAVTKPVDSKPVFIPI